MLAGQAAGTVAAVCLTNDVTPRTAAADRRYARDVQYALLQPADSVKKQKPPGVLIWPYHDVPPDADYFVAANLAAISGVYVAGNETPDFDANRPVRDDEIERANEKAARIRSLYVAPVVGALRPTTRRELVEYIFRDYDPILAN
jgi:hypothetical protein